MATLLENLATNSQLHWADYVILIAYLLIVIGVGVWSSCLNRGSVGGYFLAGRNMHWALVGASLFASNIGSGHFVGLAGSGAATGIGIIIFELNAIFVLLLLGWVFVPVYVSSGVFTMPEYLTKRFGGQRIRVYLSVLALLLYVFTKISADLYAGAVFIKQSIGWNLWFSVIMLLVLAAIFTVAGGLSAVIWTDFIQTIIMVIGAFVLMGISFVEVGGYSAIIEKFTSDAALSNRTKQYALIESLWRNGSSPLVNDSRSLATLYGNDSARLAAYAHCGRVPDNAMHLIRSADDGSLPWPGTLFGALISSVWYWCSDQVIVQRALAAKDMSHAKGATIMAGYLKLLPLFIMVFPGMIARVLFPDYVGCSDPDECQQICGGRGGCTNIAYPLLVVKLLPAGARGLMLAVMMSALMSSLTSIFNSSSTLFTMDIWRRMRSSSTDMELMIVGRCFVVVLVAISVVWIPILQNVSALFHYIQGITSFLAPPVCAVYVLAVLWKRINEQGAFWGLMVGLATGLVRFVWEYSYGSPPPCGEPDERPAIITKVHYLHFGILLFGIVCVVTVVVSLLTNPKEDAPKVHGLTFFTLHQTSGEEGVAAKPPQAAAVAASSGDLLADSEPDAMLGGSTVPLTQGKRSASLTFRNEPEPNVTISLDDDDDKGACETQPEDQKSGEQPPLPWYKKALFWICGIESMRSGAGQAKTEFTMAAEHMCIDEEPRLRRLVNANAVLLMLIAMFMFGFYA